MSENAQASKKTLRKDVDDRHYIRAAALHGSIDVLRSEQAASFLGDDCREIQSRIRGPEELIDSDDYLDQFAQIDSLFDHPGSALRIGLKQDLKSLGIFVAPIVHAETLWDAIKGVQAGLRYFQSSSSFSVNVRYNRCRLVYEHPYGRGAEADLDTQFTIGLFINVIREAAWYSQAELTVRYPGVLPSHRRLLPEVRDVLDGDTGMLEFDAFLLKSPMKQINVGIADVARQTMARIGMSNLDDTPVSKLVGILQSTSIDGYHTALPLNTAAAILDMPTRTLQAALKQEGTSFAKLREQARHKAAKRELLAGRSIAETAALVGFSQRQTFSEAFSKWQGCPPSEFLSQAHKNT